MKNLPFNRTHLRYLNQVAIIAGSYFVYMLVRKFIISDLEPVAFANALKVISFEQWAGLFWEGQWEVWVVEHSRALVIALNWIYVITFVPILLITAFIVYYKDRPKYFYYRNVWLLSFVIALVVFAMFPLAPPRFMPEYGFIDTIQRFGPSWYGDSNMAAAIYYNVFAAMPSLHFGWTILFGVLYFRMGRFPLKVFGVMYPVTTFFAIILTGNHYIVDAIGGAGVILITFLVYEGSLRLKPYASRPLAPAAANLGKATVSLYSGMLHWKAHARLAPAAAKSKLQPLLGRLANLKWKTGFPYS